MNKDDTQKRREEKQELIAKLREDPAYLAKLMGDEKTLQHMNKAREEYMQHDAPLFEELAIKETLTIRKFSY